MEPTPESIQKLHSSIAFIFDIEKDDIKSKSRLRKTTDARKAFVYFLSSHFKLMNRSISHEINKDESSIRWMFNGAESLIKTDVKFRTRINRVKSAIGIDPRVCPLCGSHHENT